MDYVYERGLFTDEQVKILFDNAQNSMQRIHEERGPYKHIAEFLTVRLGMKDPLCVQTFNVDEKYSQMYPHIDYATSIFPSIKNLWFCADDCPGESFGFLPRTGNEELYADWFAALDRGEIADYDSLYNEDHTGRFFKVSDYKKGDALIFDSRLVHQKLSSRPRRTLVFKYINSEDLENRTPLNYSRIPISPQWSRILVFDHLRYIDGHEERKRFIRETEALIQAAAAGVAVDRKQAPAEKPSQKPADLKSRIRKLIG